MSSRQKELHWGRTFVSSVEFVWSPGSKCTTTGTGHITVHRSQQSLNPQLTNPDPIVVFWDLLFVLFPSWALSGISARRGDHWIAVALSGIAETAPELADSETDCKS